MSPLDLLGRLPPTPRALAILALAALIGLLVHALLYRGLLRLGRRVPAALVIHANPDDYRTDPTGNSGGRIACGVLED